MGTRTRRGQEDRRCRAFANPRAGGIIAMGVEDGRRGHRGAGLRRHRAKSSSARATACRSASPKSDVRSMGRTAYGVRGIQLRDDDEVVGDGSAAAGRSRVDGDRATATASAPTSTSTASSRAAASASSTSRPASATAPVVGVSVCDGRRRADADHAAGSDPAYAHRHHSSHRPRHPGCPPHRHRRRRQGRLDRAKSPTAVSMVTNPAASPSRAKAT